MTSVQCAEKGITIMLNQLSKLTGEKEILLLKNRIAAGYASIAELYMSDDL